MKKIYQTPQTVILKIAAAKMVCASLVTGGNASANGITSGDARGGSLWDDDDDYDE